MNETEKKPGLRLFVVGEVSGNPREWSDYPIGRKLVLARSREEAILVAETGADAMLVHSDEAVVLSEESHVV